MYILILFLEYIKTAWKQSIQQLQQFGVDTKKEAHSLSVKGLKGTVVNRTHHSTNRESLETKQSTFYSKNKI